MNKFAFVFHPIQISDAAKKFPFMKNWPEWLVEGLLRKVPPFTAAHVTGIKSEHAEVEGWFLALTLSSRLILSLPEQYVIRKIIKTCRLAEKHGAGIVGLGALTSVVGDAGVTVARHMNIAVTTGNSYTVATSLEGTRVAANLMGHSIESSPIAVIGATGAIGSACSRILARDASDLTLVSRSMERLTDLAGRIREETGLTCRVTTDVTQALARSDIVLTVSGAATPIIEAFQLKRGAVICDVARPRDVSWRVASERDDVLVIDGGVVEVPGDNVQLNFNLGLPPRQVLACMAETIMLAMDGRYENFTLGRDLSVAQIDDILGIASRHGFRLASLRSFEKALTDEHVRKVQQAAGVRSGVAGP